MVLLLVLLLLAVMLVVMVVVAVIVAAAFRVNGDHGSDGCADGRLYSSFAKFTTVTSHRLSCTITFTISPNHHFTSHQMHQHMHQSTIRAIRHSPTTIHRRAYTI